VELLGADREAVQRLGAARGLAGEGEPAALAQGVDRGRLAGVRAAHERDLGQPVARQLGELRDGGGEARGEQEGSHVRRSPASAPRRLGRRLLLLYNPAFVGRPRRDALSRGAAPSPLPFRVRLRGPQPFRVNSCFVPASSLQSRLPHRWPSRPRTTSPTSSRVARPPKRSARPAMPPTATAPPPRIRSSPGSTTTTCTSSSPTSRSRKA